MYKISPLKRQVRIHPSYITAQKNFWSPYVDWWEPLIHHRQYSHNTIKRFLPCLRTNHDSTTAFQWSELRYALNKHLTPTNKAFQPDTFTQSTDLDCSLNACRRSRELKHLPCKLQVPALKPHEQNFLTHICKHRSLQFVYSLGTYIPETFLKNSTTLPQYRGIQTFRVVSNFHTQLRLLITRVKHQSFLAEEHKPTHNFTVDLKRWPSSGSLSF